MHKSIYNFTINELAGIKIYRLPYLIKHTNILKEINMQSELEIYLNDVTRMENLDKLSMYSYLSSIAKDTLKSYNEAKENLRIQNSPINNIIGAGMGGSGMPLTALEHLFKDEMTIAYLTSQGYILPNFTNNTTILLAISDSGETEEVISQYYQARDKKAKIIAIGRGGKLIELAKKDSIPHFIYSSPVPPRASFGFMFGSILAFLENINVIRNDKREGLIESIEIVEKLNKDIGRNVPTKDNIAKQIALSLINQIPILYTEPPFGSLGSRCAKMFNENTGTFAFYNQFPELRHNEIMGLTSANSLKKFTFILLRDNKEYSKMEDEINEIKKLFDVSSKVIEIRAEGASKLARFYYLLHLTDMITYYVAILIGKDPSITPVLQQLKDKLRSSSILPFS
jgi:glucose/mannose-6-phosphate isomerase